MTTTALVLVDAQRNMLEGAEPVPSAATVRAVLGRLLDNARGARAPVVHVLNDGPPGDPDEPFTPGWELVFEPGDAEIVVRKEQSDTFAANPGLADLLRERQVERVVIAGMQSEFCIEATSRGALAEGFKVSLPRGAHATYDGDQPAGDVSAQTETTLESEGVDVVVLSEVEFA
jgi:streptothricin hydrolase